MRDIRKIIFMLMFLLLIAGCANREGQGAELFLSGVKDVEKTEESSDSETEGSDGAEQTDGQTEVQQSLIYVQVSGAVNEPGVYALQEGSRVFEAIALAGGVNGEADIQSLNQAKPLTDGEMIYVLNAQEAQEAAEAGNVTEEQNQSQDDDRVNLNTATKEELMQLPGIGAAKAERILAWREENGSFAQIEDLMKIEGIKEGVFSKIEDCVKVQ